MATLGKLSAARHAAVGFAALGTSALAYTGLIGQPNDERFDAKQVVVTPAGEDGVRIREVVDQDFARHDRHGYERIVPNDFGIPEDITASSPDAPDQVSATQGFDREFGETTVIRIGDPDTTITGQHRYILDYTLPDARLGGGELALDIIANRETVVTERFEVVVTGLELEDPRCNVGARGTAGGCDLVRDGDVYRAVIDPLEAGDGITVGGRIVGRTEPADVSVPAIPERRDDNSTALALGMLPLSAGTGVAVYAWSRRRGRNEVYAGGAADAAYGNGPVRRPNPGAPLPAPTLAAPTSTEPATTSVRMIADEKMDELATIEFVPPTGIEPWLGAAVINEKIDDTTVSAWFSGLAAQDVLSLERDPDDATVRLSPGRHLERADAADLALIQELFADEETIELGTYDRRFASVWKQVRARQEATVQRAGLWKRLPPSAGGCGGASLMPFLLVGAVWLFVGAGGVLAGLAGLAGGAVAALAVGVLATALIGIASYRTLLPVRSAEGSAIALRTESFRRFLAASEGQHVEWAWKHGILREYSAWAVALGAAGAWEHALEQSNVPPADYVTGPLLVYSMSGAFSGSYTAPSSSGAGGSFGGGGGFSGGSVGGGGGGGSSGSW